MLWKLALLAVALAAVPLTQGASHSSRASAVAPQTVTVRWGPLTVPGGGHHDANPGSTNNLLVPGVQKPCTDCYLTGIVPNLVLSDGTTANFDSDAMLHHMVIFNPQHQDPTCEDRKSV